MRDRFLAVITPDRDLRTRLCGRAQRLPGAPFHPALETGWCTVLMDREPDTRPAARDAKGIVVGPIFDAAKHGERACLDAAAMARAGRSRGQHLIEAYWGGYVAILVRDGGGVDVVRAPMGELPCYYVEHHGAVIIASSAGLLATAGCIVPSIDWDAIAWQLMAGDVRRPATCLAGVSELQGGNRLSISCGPPVVDTLWSPWDFSSLGRALPSAEEAVGAVRAACLGSVAARAADGPRALLKISGGLDSSIVAACLAESGRPFDLVTMVTDNPTGDERRYARLVADRLGKTLREEYRQLATIDLGRSAAAGQPVPNARSFAQESARIAREAAAAVGGARIFDGGGGDNVFCSLRSPAPAADTILAGQVLRHFRPACRSIARLTDASAATVALRAARRAWGRPRNYRWPLDTRMLTERARRAVEPGPIHPWLDSPAGALPGKGAHVALMVAAQSYVEGLDPEDALPTIAPLLSQPVVEACLRVPSWRWLDDGHNRAVARAAFADLLPAEIVGRRSKGTPDGFVAAIYEANRDRLRTLLVGGHLASTGLIDLDAVQAMLDDPRPVSGSDYGRIMQFADVEAWAQSWSPFPAPRVWEA